MLGPRQHKFECDQTLKKQRMNLARPAEIMICDWKPWTYQLENAVLIAHITQYISGYNSNTMKRDHAVVLRFKYCDHLPFNRKFQLKRAEYIPISEAQKLASSETIYIDFLGKSMDADWIRTNGPTPQYIRIPRLNLLEVEDSDVRGVTTAGVVLPRPEALHPADVRLQPAFYEVTKVRPLSSSGHLANLGTSCGRRC